MYRTSRKTTPKVTDGKVQKKNRHKPTRRNSMGVKFGRPSDGNIVVVSKDDFWKFIRLIPDWKRISADLEQIYFSGSYPEPIDTEMSGEGWYGYPDFPTIQMDAWNGTLRKLISGEYQKQHADLFLRLGVEIEETEEGKIAVFNENSARAFQLLHVFLHELGHHHYRITKGRGKDAGSEKYAEQYALKTEKSIWRRYCEAFHFKPN